MLQHTNPPLPFIFIIGGAGMIDKEEKEMSEGIEYICNDPDYDGYRCFDRGLYELHCD
jgi:hypothetical protein